MGWGSEFMGKTFQAAQLTHERFLTIQWNLDLRKPDLRKNLGLRKIVATTKILVHTRSGTYTL